MNHEHVIGYRLFVQGRVLRTNGVRTTYHSIGAHDGYSCLHGYQWLGANDLGTNDGVPLVGCQ